MAMWAEDRAAYFAELGRFVDVYCATMAASAAAFRSHVETGPRAWAAETLRRIDALPAAAHGVPPDVDRNRIGDDTALGMCGVLRPILTLDRVRV